MDMSELEFTRIPEVELTLVPSPDDPPIETQPYQIELIQFEVSLLKTLNVNDVRGLPRRGRVADDNALYETYYAPVEPFSGDFAIKLAAIIGPAFGTAVGAWLHAKYGRKVRLKIGEIEAEAQTTEEVEKLLARAQEIQQRNQQPKVIL